MRNLIVASLSTVALSTACAPSVSPAPAAGAGGEGAIAAVHAHRCSKCHALPQPNTRTRAQLDEVVPRHRKRIHLSDAEWRAMVDYLAIPGDAGASGTPASSP